MSKNTENHIVVDEYLNYLDEISVHDTFNHVIIKLTAGEATVGALVAASAIIYYAVKAAAKYMTPKKCRNYKLRSVDYDICMKEVGIKRREFIISQIRNRMGLCKNTKKPEKCKKKLQTKIDKLKVEIKDQKNTIERLKNKKKE